MINDLKTNHGTPITAPSSRTRRCYLFCKCLPVLAAIILLTGTSTAFAKTAIYRTAAHPGYVLIKGTSTLHNWSIRSRGLSGTAVFARSRTGSRLILKKIHLSIAVLSLKGSDGSGMDATIDRKLISGRFPKIVYVLKHAVLSHKPQAGAPWAVWNTTGTLTAAGHPTKVKLKLKVLSAPNGTVSIETRTILKMTEFGINPPTAMLGVIRSGDKMHIKVLWNLSPIKAAGGAKK